MTLTPIPTTSIFNKARDPWFNHDAAEWVYETVMKMDADSAEMFTFLVGCEMLDADIQANLRTYQKRLDEVVTKRIDRIKKAVFSVSKARGEVDDDFAHAVQQIEEICKKKPKDQQQWDLMHPRGNPENAGQFRRKIKHPLKEPIYDNTATALGVPDEIKSMTDLDAKAEAQAEYLQLADFLENYKSIGDPVQDRIVLHVRDRNDPDKNTYRLLHSGGDKPKVSDWDPNTRVLTHVQAHPQTTTIGGAAFDLGRALGAPAGVAAAGGRHTQTFHEKFPGFSDEWVQPGSVANDNDRRFNRVQHTAQFVGAFAPPGSHVSNAAKLAELVGEHGPQAEKVIGPHMRKTSYRYRGTEKTPEPALVREVNVALANAKARTRDGGSRSTGLQQMVADRAADAGRPPTWDERGAARAAAVDYFLNPANEKMPSKRLYALQLAAGNTPPSEGVILDKKGKIVTQAVGYGDDHYLPFNLRSLKGLRGGEYVRTRSVGGPTAEDVYTGLISGARQITVASRSGTFTVQFDETFKGGRRYNDKTKRMTDRYEHLLDAVESEQIDNQPVPREVAEMIDREVKEKYGAYPLKDQRHYYKQKIDEYKSYDGLDEHDQALIDAQMRSMPISDLTDRQVKSIRSELVANRMAEKEFKFRLNGDGYYASMQALKEQFPYYIADVKYRPRRDEYAPEPEKDKGYVMPRHNRPHDALHGYYNTRVAGVGTYTTVSGQKTGKIHASEANYQNWSNANGTITSMSPNTAPHRAAGQPDPDSPATTPGQTQARTGGPQSPFNRPLNSSEQAAERARENTNLSQYNEAVWNAMRAVPPAPGQNYSMYQAFTAASGNNRPAFDTLMATAAGRNDARTFFGVPAHAAALAADPNFQRMQVLDDLIDRPTYSQAAGLSTYDTKPYRGFAGKAYSLVATQDEITSELAEQQRGVLPISQNKSYEDMTGPELKTEFDRLKALRAEKANIPNDISDNNLLTALMITEHGNARQLVHGADPNALDQQIEKLHRIRTLKSNRAALAVQPPTTPTVPGGTLTPQPGGSGGTGGGTGGGGTGGGTGGTGGGVTNPTSGMPPSPNVDANLIMDVVNRVRDMETFHGTNTGVGPGGQPLHQAPAGYPGGVPAWLDHLRDVRNRMQEGNRIKNEVVAGSRPEQDLRNWYDQNKHGAFSL